MPYPSEPSSSLGLAQFLEQLDDSQLQGYDHLLARLEGLSSSLKREHVLVFQGAHVHLIPVAISVDGGEGLAFRKLPIFSVGMIRVAAHGYPNVVQTPEPLVYVIPSPAVLAPATADTEQTDGLDEGFQRAMETLFTKPTPQSVDGSKPTSPDVFVSHVVQTFSQATGIGLSDLGCHYAKDIKAFTRVLREILEWAYLVWLIERSKQQRLLDFRRILFIKDGRLAQVGVANSFRERLMKYFEDHHVLLVGVSKTSRLVAEGLTSLVVGQWLERQQALLDHGQFVIRVPEELLRASYHYERQWNADEENTFVMGRRFVMRLFEEVFHPLDSVTVFDVPTYLEEEEIKAIASALYAQRSVLYQGSIGSLVDAHMAASISHNLALGLEDTLLRKLKGLLDEDRYQRFRRWVQT